MRDGNCLINVGLGEPEAKLVRHGSMTVRRAPGAIADAMVGIANAADAPASARAMSRALLPITVGLLATAGYFNRVASFETGEPIDVMAARAILPGDGALAGGAFPDVTLLNGDQFA